MSYEDAQVVSQLLSFAIFAAMLFAAFIYAFKKSNRKKFEVAASAPLRSNDRLLSGD